MRRVVVAALAVAGLATSAQAQTAQDLVGVWRVVTIERVAADGTRTEAFGPSPRTRLIFTANGHFSQAFLRADIPKFASNNSLTGTAEENAAVVRGSSFSFGTWTIADKTVTLSFDGASFPNWTGTQAARLITRYTGDELAWTVPTGSAGTRIETVFQRMK